MSLFCKCNNNNDFVQLRTKDIAIISQAQRLARTKMTDLCEFIKTKGYLQWKWSWFIDEF